MKTQWNLYPGKTGLLVPDAGKAFNSNSGAMYCSGAKLEREHMLDAADQAFRLQAQHGLKPGQTFRKLLEEHAGSLSTITKSAIGKGISKEVRARAMWSLCDMLFSAAKTVEPDVSDLATPPTLGFEEWAGKVKLKPLVVGHRYTDELAGFSSDVLAIVEIKKTISALSLVIGPAIYDEDILLNAAAVYAANSAGVGVSQGVIIRVPRDAEDFQKVNYEVFTQRGKVLKDNFTRFNLKLSERKLCNEYEKTYTAEAAAEKAKGRKIA